MPVDRPNTIDIELLAIPIEVAVVYSLRAPRGSAGLIADWDRPSMVRPAQRVPVAAESVLLHRPHAIVKFRNLREGSPSKGVHLADLFGRHSQPSTLQGAEDIVLHGFGGLQRELNFIINWPGYAPERSTIRTVSDNGGPLTRSELGKNIMMTYGRFFRKVVSERILSRQIGSYNIALHQGQDSRPNSLGIHLWQLHLVAFREPAPGDNHWVAEIDVVPA